MAAPPITPDETPKVSDPMSDDKAVDSDKDRLFGLFRRKRKTEEPAAAPAAELPAEDKPALMQRLRERLSRTRKGLVEGMADLMLGKKAIDDEVLDELETRLLMADVGVDATRRIIGGLTERVSRKQLTDVAALMQALREEMIALLAPCQVALQTPDSIRPFTILMVGVNGAGKTTTIGKLARRFKLAGHKVMLAAGDTFRAAAVEQLGTWGERNQVPVIAQGQGADAASVIFDAYQAARARDVHILIADTAGRLHTQSNLMDELRKIKRVLGKQDSGAPHEVLLVLDAGNGQNALAQAAQFHDAVGVTGIVLTKLDGTAKGGIVFAIAERLGLPIRYVGVGESADDLRPFDAAAFVDALIAIDTAAGNSAMP